jgi:hypothetical protein
MKLVSERTLDRLGDRILAIDARPDLVGTVAPDRPNFFIVVASAHGAASLTVALVLFVGARGLECVVLVVVFGVAVAVAVTVGFLVVVSAAACACASRRTASLAE